MRDGQKNSLIKEIHPCPMPSKYSPSGFGQRANPPKNKIGRVDTKCYTLSPFSTIRVVRDTRQILFLLFKSTRDISLLVTKARLETPANGRVLIV